MCTSSNTKVSIQKLKETSNLLYLPEYKPHLQHSSSTCQACPTMQITCSYDLLEQLLLHVCLKLRGGCCTCKHSASWIKSSISCSPFIPSSPCFLPLPSLRNMAFPFCDSSQMAVAETHRWSPHPPPSVSATQMVQSTSRVSNQGALAKPHTSFLPGWC